MNETYVVRIYRRGAKIGTQIEGIVEEAGTNRVTAFHSAAELVGLLTTRNRRPRKTKVPARS